MKNAIIAAIAVIGLTGCAVHNTQSVPDYVFAPTRIKCIALVGRIHFLEKQLNMQLNQCARSEFLSLQCKVNVFYTIKEFTDKRLLDQEMQCLKTDSTHFMATEEFDKYMKLKADNVQKVEAFGARLDAEK